jgi:hypothetical protein
MRVVSFGAMSSCKVLCVGMSRLHYHLLTCKFRNFPAFTQKLRGEVAAKEVFYHMAFFIFHIAKVFFHIVFCFCHIAGDHHAYTL